MPVCWEFCMRLRPPAAAVGVAATLKNLVDVTCVACDLRSVKKKPWPLAARMGTKADRLLVIHNGKMKQIHQSYILQSENTTHTLGTIIPFEGHMETKLRKIWRVAFCPSYLRWMRRTLQRRAQTFLRSLHSPLSITVEPRYKRLSRKPENMSLATKVSCMQCC